MYKFREFYIPERMKHSIQLYIKRGVIPGDFLQAVICNNLKMACAYADDENLVNIPAYAAYFYNEAPAGCWGSREKMMTWSEKVIASLREG